MWGLTIGQRRTATELREGSRRRQAHQPAVDEPRRLEAGPHEKVGFTRGRCPPSRVCRHDARRRELRGATKASHRWRGRRSGSWEPVGTGSHGTSVKRERVARSSAPRAVGLLAEAQHPGYPQCNAQDARGGIVFPYGVDCQSYDACPPSWRLLPSGRPFPVVHTVPLVQVRSEDDRTRSSVGAEAASRPSRACYRGDPKRCGEADVETDSSLLLVLAHLARRPHTMAMTSTIDTTHPPNSRCSRGHLLLGIGPPAGTFCLAIGVAALRFKGYTADASRGDRREEGVGPFWASKVGIDQAPVGTAAGAPSNRPDGDPQRRLPKERARVEPNDWGLDLL